MEVSNYNLNNTKKEIIEALSKVKSTNQTSESKESDRDYLKELLSFKNQQELMISQNKFNKKMSDNSKWLVIATWALVGATLLVMFCKK